MAYLKDLPVTSSRSTSPSSSTCTNDPNDAIIVRSVVDLGHNLGLQTVAEGVENQSTWDLLTELGCGSAQGYVLARPMAADIFWSWLHEYSTREPAGAGPTMVGGGLTAVPL